MFRFSPDFETAVRVRGLTASRVAELARVAPATVSAALHGRRVTLQCALRIARAVHGCSVIPELAAWAEAPASDSEPPGVAA
jgi:hypothetical protein